MVPVVVQACSWRSPLNKANGSTVNAQNILYIGHVLQLRFTVLVWIIGVPGGEPRSSFQLNRHWTFRNRGKAPWLKEFMPFLAVGSAAALVGIFIKIGFTNPTSPFYLPEPWFHENAGLQSREYWAQLLTIVITTPINFGVNKVWTFRHVRRRHAETETPTGIR